MTESIFKELLVVFATFGLFAVVYVLDWLLHKTLGFSVFGFVTIFISSVATLAVMDWWRGKL